MKYSLQQQRVLRDRAKAECLRLDAIRNDPEREDLINRFKSKFANCEIVYKIILEEHQYQKTKKHLDRLTIDMKQAPYALSFAGYQFDRNLLTELFGSRSTVGNRSVKKLRDDLTHNLKDNAIEELTNRNTELHNYMDQFLNTIRTFDT